MRSKHRKQGPQAVTQESHIKIKQWRSVDFNIRFRVSLHVLHRHVPRQDVSISTERSAAPSILQKRPELSNLENNDVLFGRLMAKDLDLLVAADAVAVKWLEQW